MPRGIFNVLAISDTHINGQNIEIPIKEIRSVNKIEMSTGKTIVLVTGIVVLALVINEVGKGLAEPLGNIITNL